MNITQEKIDDLNAIVTVKVEENDYKESVDTVLKGYKKKASMPGFRPGMVPKGMIKKMYGRQVLADELNKLLQENLNKYIVDNKIEVLGSPMAKENERAVDFKDKDYEFSYEIGLAPKFDVEVSEKGKFNKYKITVDDKLLEKYTEDIRRAYGKLVEGDISVDKDLLTAEFVELDASGNVKEGGVTNKSSVAIDTIGDEKSKKSLIGKKKGDTIVVDVEKISKSETDMAAMLGIQKEDVAKINKSFNLTIADIRRSEPAEINEELFEKLYGKDGEVKTVKDFNDKITVEIEKILAVESDRKLRKDVTDELVKKAKMQLPDEFLKRWLVSVNEKPTTIEEVTKEYENYSESVKWQLIENKIIKDNDIKVEPEEAKEEAKKMIRNQMAQYGMMDIKEEDIEKYSETLLQQEKEARNLYQQIYDEKLLALFKEKFKLKEKEVTYDEFVDVLKSKNENILQRMNKYLYLKDNNTIN